ncbi:MAG: leucine-rich repeat protein, partial [Lachnospiraceae bacterium]|nr:leucine-rich repeat protein [Lachnospiraceae bacterium]
MERKVREICKKSKILAMVLAVVFMVLAQSAVVKAEETVEVTVDGILYELDEENKIASLKTYTNKSDANCKEIIIPNQVVYDGERYTVTSIGNSAFKDAQYLEWITIPNTVESIGNEALCNCKNIKKLVIPDSVMSMGDSSIQGCTSLEEVVLPAKLEDLSLAMLNGCVNLNKITLPENLKGIAIAAFNGCVSLEQLTLPNSLQAIGWGAFSNCTGLTQLVIPEGVEYASGDCIDGCSNMEAVFYPANLKESFEESALETVVQVSYIVNDDGTVSLTGEHLPEGMTEISLPRDIGGRQIVSITGPQGVNLPVSCTKHYTKTYTK